MIPLESVNPDASAGEIDIYEGQGNIPKVDTATFHWGQGTQQIGTDDNTGVDLSQAYHTYGVDWEPGHITWYLDGKAIQTVTSAQAAITSVPMFLILDVWLGGWNGQPDSTTPFPATMNVDYVHVWQTGAAGANGAASVLNNVATSTGNIAAATIVPVAQNNLNTINLAGNQGGSVISNLGV
jgi:beta-glucanase (GH16 family)